MKAYCWETIAELSKEGRGPAHSRSSDLASNIVHGIEFSKFNEASIKNKVGLLLHPWCYTLLDFYY